MPLSDDCCDVSFELLTSLVGDGEVSLEVWSDSSSSAVKDPPLLLVKWHVVLDSQSVLVSTDVFVPEQGSTTAHLRSQLESDSVGNWLLWILSSLLVDPPGLVGSVVAIPEDDMSSLGIACPMDIETFLSIVLDVLLVLAEPSDSILVISSIGSDAGSSSDIESVS